MTELVHLNPFTLNLRWILKLRGARPDDWAKELVGLTRKRIGFSRAVTLLSGAEPLPEEVNVLIDMTDFDREELITAPIYTREQSLLGQNIRHLVEAIPHGQGKEAAGKIGITEGQLSRWKKWKEERKPHRTNLRKLLKFHGMDPDIDLEEVPVFLSMEPLSGYAQKEWVSTKVNEMPASEVAKIYPALKKLFRSDEEN